MGINTISSFASQPELASQINNTGKILTTDGNATAWTQPAMTLIANSNSTGQPFGGYNYSGGTPSQITFQNIPQNFKHLKIVGTVIGVNNNDQIYMDINNSMACYWSVGSIPNYSNTTGYNLPARISVGTAGGMPNNFEITIPAYSTTVSGVGTGYYNQRSYMSLLGQTMQANNGYAGLGGGWFTTNTGTTITGIQFWCSQPMAQFTASLYGMNQEIIL